MVGGEAGFGRHGELVRAAFNRVADGGLEGLRLRQVAEDVGIDHSTLHHHFATKQDLIESVAAYATAQFHGTAPPGPDPRTRLTAHLHALQRLLDRWPELFIVTAELDLRARRDPTMRAAMNNHESGWRAALIEMCTAAAGPQVADPRALVETVIAVVKGVRLTPALAPQVFAQLTTLLADEH